MAASHGGVTAQDGLFWESELNRNRTQSKPPAPALQSHHYRGTAPPQPQPYPLPHPQPGGSPPPEMKSRSLSPNSLGLFGGIPPRKLTPEKSLLRKVFTFDVPGLKKTAQRTYRSKSRAIQLASAAVVAVSTLILVIYLAYTTRRAPPNHYRPPHYPRTVPAPTAPPPTVEPKLMSVRTEVRSLEGTTSGAVPPTRVPVPTSAWREFLHDVSVDPVASTLAHAKYRISFKDAATDAVDSSHPIMVHYRVEEEATKTAYLASFKPAESKETIWVSPPLEIPALGRLSYWFSYFTAGAQKDSKVFVYRAPPPSKLDAKLILDELDHHVLPHSTLSNQFRIEIHSNTDSMPVPFHWIDVHYTVNGASEEVTHRMQTDDHKQFEFCCVSLTLTDRLKYYFTVEIGGVVAESKWYDFPPRPDLLPKLEPISGPQFARAPPPQCVTRDQLAKDGVVLGFVAESNRFVFAPSAPASAMFQWVEVNYQVNGGPLISQRMSKLIAETRARPLTFELSLGTSANPGVDRISFYYTIALIAADTQQAGIRETCVFDYTPHLVADSHIDILTPSQPLPLHAVPPSAVPPNLASPVAATPLPTPPASPPPPTQPPQQSPDSQPQSTVKSQPQQQAEQRQQPTQTQSNQHTNQLPYQYQQPPYYPNQYYPPQYPYQYQPQQQPPQYPPYGGAGGAGINGAMNNAMRFNVDADSDSDSDGDGSETNEFESSDESADGELHTRGIQHHHGRDGKPHLTQELLFQLLEARFSEQLRNQNHPPLFTAEAPNDDSENRRVVHSAKTHRTIRSSPPQRSRAANDDDSNSLPPPKPRKHRHANDQTISGQN